MESVVEYNHEYPLDDNDLQRNKNYRIELGRESFLAREEYAHFFSFD